MPVRQASAASGIAGWLLFEAPRMLREVPSLTGFDACHPSPAGRGQAVLGHDVCHGRRHPGDGGLQLLSPRLSANLPRRPHWGANQISGAGSMVPNVGQQEKPAA